MSSGVPVVATDVGANPEEVADGVTGILVPLGNHIAMAEAVIVLLEDPLRREQLGKAGRSWVMQNFNLDAQSAKLDSIYSALIGNA
jgi:glycosyltransferase involved in cell wall biosynthesis